MRIDYSEPKKSCSAPQTGQNRPRKESSGSVLIVAFITGFISLGIGFGSGWMLSQRSAKDGFKAAMAQQSLENQPQLTKPAPLQLSPATPAPQSDPADGAETTADPQLSFYKTLPSGQKNNVMGSGINSKEVKPTKQPLQAAIPTNLIRATPPQSDDNAQNTAIPDTPAKQTPPPQEQGSFTIQVASYLLRSDAEAHRSKLAAKGYIARIVGSNLGDKGVWYRVRVGKKLGSEDAKELAGKLGKDAILIPDKD